ncbi:hypothetical protein DIS07_10130 [Polaribacter aquimarinus]|uniref:Uncharacterized protein n=1 Tax=Polaribacter aquimarinus TaxID=2100726 RepID=A0A2U2J984_9FLAO|nr:hypothetical protein DIS07_10130 [Polaribacter aquimarinus]
METILGLFIITFIILIFVNAYKNIFNPKHDYSGNLDKQKEDYENTFLYLIDIIKSLFKK